MVDEIGAKNTTIVEEPNELIDIKVKSPHWMIHGNNSFSFSKGNIHQQLDKIFFRNSTYVFSRTVVNPEAVKLINDNTEMLSKKSSCDLDILFRPNILDIYLNAIDQLCENHNIKHVRFPLIERRGFAGTSSAHPDQIYWPVIHVVRGVSGHREFEKLVTQLNRDEAYELIKEREAPWNYHRIEVDFIHDENVDPLMLENRVWKVKSEMLRDAVDFLVQSTYTHKYHGYSED